MKLALPWCQKPDKNSTGKIQRNIPYKHKYKNLQQNNNKSNPEICKKNNTP